MFNKHNTTNIPSPQSFSFRDDTTTNVSSSPKPQDDDDFGVSDLAGDSQPLTLECVLPSSSGFETFANNSSGFGSSSTSSSWGDAFGTAPLTTNTSDPTPSTSGFSFVSTTPAASSTTGFGFGVANTSTFSGFGGSTTNSGLFNNNPQPSFGTFGSTTNTAFGLTNTTPTVDGFSFVSVSALPENLDKSHEELRAEHISNPKPAVLTGFSFGPPTTTTTTTTTVAKPFTFGTPTVEKKEEVKPHIITGLSLLPFLNDKRTADVELKFGDRTVFGHKFILSLYSKVLEQSFIVTSHEQNSNGIQLTKIELPDYAFSLGEEKTSSKNLEQVFDLVIQIIYGKDIEYSDITQLVNMFIVAGAFGIQQIVTTLEKEMGKFIKTCKSEEHEKLASFAFKSNNTSLLLLLLDQVPALNLLDREEWADVGEELLLSILQGDNLNVADESPVYKCAAKWIEKNKPNTDSHPYLPVINCIRFPYLPLDVLLRDIPEHNWLSEKQLTACLKYQVALEKNLDTISRTVQTTAVDSENGVQLSFEPRESYRKVNIDLLFVCDTTGSMSAEIEVAQQTIINIMQELSNKCKGVVRFALIAYKDFSDQDTIKSYPFTTDLVMAKSYVGRMAASGGGDEPEAVATALYEATQMKFNPSAKKLCVLIGDAPPHGMGSNGDTYPNGDPNGNDWIALADEIHTMGVTCYTLVCDRAKDNHIFTLFMDTLAQKTNGRCILLSNAEKLPDFLINSTLEELEIESVVSQYLKNLSKEEKEKLTAEEISQLVGEHVKTNNIAVNTVDVFTVKSTGAELLKNAKCVDTSSRGVFGSSTSAAFASNTTGGFSFGSTTYQQPSQENITKVASNLFSFRK